MSCKATFLFNCKLCLVFFIYLFILSHSLITDTLNQGHILNSTDRLVSKNGRFTLGFSGKYLMINSTPVAGSNVIIISHPLWLAYRDTLVLENSGTLILDSTTGLLKIEYGNGEQIELCIGCDTNRNVRDRKSVV